MGLFSRRRPQDDEPSNSGPDEATPESIPDEPVPVVPISFSGVGGGPVPPPEPVSAPGSATEQASVFSLPDPEAPEAVETIPGVRDNVLLVAALQELTPDPPAQATLNVMRQMLQGELFLRVRGNAQELVAAGEPLPLAIGTRGDEKIALVFSGGAALQAAVIADGDEQTSAVSKPATEVLADILQDDFVGVAVDYASGVHSAILPRQLLERALADVDPALALKKLLSQPRRDDTAALIAEEMTSAPLWIAVRQTPSGDYGVAEVRTSEGARFLEVFSHPLELLALGRGDEPAPIAAAQLAAALRSDEGVLGVILNPAGPWISLTRDDLVPLLSLPEPGASPESS